MVYLIAQLKIENYDQWKPVFNGRSGMHKENSTKEARLFRNFHDQNEVIILFEWDNKKNAKKYIEFASEQKNLQKAGIKKLETNFLMK